MSKLVPTVTRRYALLMGELFIEGYSKVENYRKLFDCEFYSRLGFVDPIFYYGPEAFEFGDFIVRTKKDLFSYLDRMFERIYAFGEELLHLSIRIKNKDYTNDSHEELINLFKEFADKYQTFSLSLMGFNLQHHFEKKLKEVLKYRENKDEELSVLTFPKKENFSTIEMKSLLHICGQISNVNDLSSKELELIDKHLNDFSWIGARGMMEEPWTRENLITRLRELKGNSVSRLSDIETHQQEMEVRSKNLLNELNADERLREYVRISKELVYYRTYRTDYLNLIFVNIKPLLEAIGKHFKLSYRDVLYFRPHEIISKVNVDQDELKRRAKRYAVLTLEPEKLIFTADPKEIKKWQKEYCDDSYDKDSEIKGNIAYSGKIRGRVKVVITKADIGKVEAGDILVTPMTTPDFITAMEKAAAFVTDEGGITCHASIIAREMKKPCVIGTKKATKVLKDGDLVEVDAEKGIVRKVNI